MAHYAPYVFSAASVIDLTASTDSDTDTELGLDLESDWDMDTDTDTEDNRPSAADWATFEAHMTKPASYTSYNIRHRFLQASTQHHYHKNAEWEGNRYTIVLFNLNTCYANHIDERTRQLTEQPPHSPRYLDVHTGTEVERTRAHLLAVCEGTRFPMDRCSVRGGKATSHSKYGDTVGYVIPLGEVKSRESRKDREERGLVDRSEFGRKNLHYMDVYDAFCAYMDAVCVGLFGMHGQYRSAIISKNSACTWHLDESNVGDAVLSCIGEFRRGELLVEDSI